MSRKRRQLYFGFLSYFAVVLGCAVFPPVIRLWNRIDPHVLGLPFAQATVIAISVLLTGGLALWFILEGRLNVEERSARQWGHTTHGL